MHQDDLTNPSAVEEGPLTLQACQESALERLPAAVHGYFAAGAGDEHLLAANEACWGRWALRQRVLVGVTDRDPSVSLLGRRRPLPLLVAPMAWQTLAHPDGEPAAARGACAAGAIYCLSSWASTPLEDVAAAVDGDGTLWMQTQLLRDREITYDIVARARAAGFEAIMLTVDQPVAGRRDRSLRLAFERPGSPNLHGRIAELDPGVTWDDVAELVSVAELPVVAKGILDPEDAPLAVEAGCAGVIVSNHGGRQLDAVLPTGAALPSVADAVAESADVLVDGGIRRGSDVVKALALGAQAVLVGRPFLWALAAGGEVAVRRAVETLATEIDLALAITGVPTAEGLSRDILLPVP